MIHTFERWMRRVLPPFWVGLIALAALAWVWLINLGITAWTTMQFGFGLADMEWTVPKGHRELLGAMAFAYGGWRVAGFHPFYRPRYREWLKTVAWDPSKSLPFGPPTLVWQDFIVILLLALLSMRAEMTPVYFAAMLASWSVMLTAANYGAGLDNLALAAALALLPATLSQFYPLLALTALPAYLIARAGINPSLQSFPWESMPRWEALRASSLEQLGRPSDFWPLLRTYQYGNVTVGVKLPHALKLATLAGAVAATFTLGCELDDVARGFRHASGEAGRIQAILAPCLLISGIRLLLYCGTCRPPISFAGRLATRRLIIPSYDQVFVAPLLVLLIGFGGPMILWHWGVSDPLAAGITMFAMVAIGLGIGPDLGRWQLTGEHRIVVRAPAARHRARRAAK